MVEKIELALNSWSAGISNEIKFWKQWVETKGDRWQEEFTTRMSGENMLSDLFVKLLPPTGKVYILDVGSGPITSIGVMLEGREIHLRACDPLAEAYFRIFKLAKLIPPVQTEFAAGEALSASFKPNLFDIVNCRNALDHSSAPFQGIREMLKVCKVGGYVVLDHHINEAEREKYSGFHQHNFDEQDGDFVIWNKDARINVSKEISKFAATEVKVGGNRNSILVILKKIACPNTLPEDLHWHDLSIKMKECVEKELRTNLLI